MSSCGWHVRGMGVLYTCAVLQASAAADDAFTRARLTPTEIREVIAVIERSAYDTPESWPRELRVQRIDLGTYPGVIVQGTSLLCGGTGNCQIFALRKSNGHWVSLFQDGQQVIADRFTLGPGAAHGIPDLTVTVNVGADTERHVTFHFDGHVYRRP